jgi:hypothetical protein
MKRFLYLIFATALLCACATIDHTESIKQPLERVLLAGPGDLLLRIDRERNLENVFGKSDIFGRKTKEGLTELRFGGVETNGEIVLLRKDVQIVTNETTMSRTPISTTTGRSTASVSGTTTTDGRSTALQATGVSNYSSITLLPASDFHVVIPPDTVAVRLGQNEKRLPIAGYVIEIITVSRNALEYKILKQQ